MTISRVLTSCWADPLVAINTSDILKPYEYSPLVIEASILSDEESVRRSTEQIQKKLPTKRVEGNDANRYLKSFLEKRSSFLSILQSIPEVKTFVRFANDKAEEVRKTQEEVRQFLTEIGAIEDLQKELSREMRLQFKGRDFLIDSIRTNISSGNEDLKEPLVNYIADFNTILRKLVNKTANPETVYVILAADVQFVAPEKQLLNTAHSLAIPLDLSPLRLSLALIDEKETFDQCRRYYPPIFLLFNPKASAMDLARPYRTIDGHPIFIRAPKFEADKTRAQRESSAARKMFEQRIGPLLYAVKGLAGTREIAPSLITKPLIEVVRSYLSFNPMSKDLLRIVDFGCGTGALSAKIFTRVLDRTSLDETINVYALLNDDSQVNPGKSFRRLSVEERFAGLFDSRAWKGDLRRLIIELDSLNERFDIALINRVLDMYGGYGIFEFKFNTKEMGRCSSFTETKHANEPGVGDVVVFSESTCHEDAWRAINYIFERQIRKKEKGSCILPAIDMKMKKNFFDFDGLDILKLLLKVTKLLIVSVFPGDFESLFPEVNAARDNIFHCEKPSKTTYSVICISRSKNLIKHIKIKCPDFE